MMVILILLAVFVLSRIGFWYREGRRMQTSGYLPPAPGRFARFSYKLFSRILTFIYLGKLKIIGSENGFFEGRLLIGPQHQHGMDPFPVNCALPYSFRQIAAAKEVTGVLSGPAAWCGTFAVPVERGKAKNAAAAAAAIDACVKVLLSHADSKLLLFPQGHLEVSARNAPESYRKGAARIVKRVQSLVNGQPLAYLPIAIYYKDTPEGSSLGRRLLHRLITAGLHGGKNFINFILRCSWRLRVLLGKQSRAVPPRQVSLFMSTPKYGVVVAIGKAIPAAQLPDDPAHATRLIRDRIVVLYEQARAA